MHKNIDPTLLQDTSTQAMTEVALGLSMAFFALLIIALMSVALPVQTPSDMADNNLEIPSQNGQGQSNHTLELALQALINSLDAKTKSASASALDSIGQHTTVLFYWDGRFFNAQEQVVQINEANMQHDIIVAVSPQLPFSQLMAIQDQFKGDKMRLTTLSPAWQNRLSNMP